MTSKKRFCLVTSMRRGFRPQRENPPLRLRKFFYLAGLGGGRKFESQRLDKQAGPARHKSCRIGNFLL